MKSLTTSKYQVGVIGVGIMGEALLSGLLDSGFPSNQLSFAEKRSERAAEITTKYGSTLKSLNNLVAASDVVLLVVKPQDLEEVLGEISGDLKQGSFVVSFAAGKRTDFISSRIPAGVGVIRVMPNTPTLVGLGMSAISAGPSASKAGIEFVETFLSATGKVVSVDEKLQDAVTAVSGSGPAYFFAFVEAMVAAGIELGLSHEVATELTIQTIVGAAGMLEKSGESATTLRKNVTSPNGTTAAALAVFQENKLGESVKQAMIAARNRSQELA
jgi:pyrroline-5-carboxylate reductase